MTSLHIPNGVTIGTAPDSWGVWFPDDPVQVPVHRSSSSEAAAAGYEWIELGPYGYLPTDPSELADALAPGNFKVTAGTVFEHLQRPRIRGTTCGSRCPTSRVWRSRQARSMSW